MYNKAAKGGIWNVRSNTGGYYTDDSVMTVAMADALMGLPADGSGDCRLNRIKGVVIV